jgi:plasmid stabilization system protein ParE
MNSDESVDTSTYADQMQLAERELTSFIGAVTELFGPEEARLSADDWLDESESMGGPPRTARDWRAVTIAASARLASRLAVAGNHRALAAATDAEASLIQYDCPSCFSFKLLA